MKTGGDRPSSGLGGGGDAMEEWETASESSEKSDMKGKNNFVGGSSKENTPKDSSVGRGGGPKKNFNSQRGGGGDRGGDRNDYGGDRGGRRGGYDGGGYRGGNSNVVNGRGGGGNRGGNNRGGGGPPAKNGPNAGSASGQSSGNSTKNPSSAVPKNGDGPVALNNSSNNTENHIGPPIVSTVYRLNEVILDDPEGIENALSEAAAKKSSAAAAAAAVAVTKKGHSSSASSASSSSSSSSSEFVSSSSKLPQNAHDPFAHIDLNNIASVVVVDDQPEVTVEDESFIFDSNGNDGFSKVVSRKSAREKKKKEETIKQLITDSELAVILSKVDEKNERNRSAGRMSGGSGVGGSSGGAGNPSHVVDSLASKLALGADKKKNSARLSKLPPRLVKQKEKEAATKKTDVIGKPDMTSSSSLLPTCAPPAAPQIPSPTPFAIPSKMET